MTKLSVKLDRKANIGEVRLDGVRIPMVRAFKLEATHNEIPVAFLEVLITGEIDVEVEGALVKTRMFNPRTGETDPRAGVEYEKSK